MKASWFRETRGLWIGLGIALVILAMSSTEIVRQQTMIECIKARGEWHNIVNQCEFNSKEH